MFCVTLCCFFLCVWLCLYFLYMDIGHVLWIGILKWCGFLCCHLYYYDDYQYILIFKSDFGRCSRWFYYHCHLKEIYSTVISCKIVRVLLLGSVYSWFDDRAAIVLSCHGECAVPCSLGPCTILSTWVVCVRSIVFGSRHFGLGFGSVSGLGHSCLCVCLLLWVHRSQIRVHSGRTLFWPHVCLV